MGMFKKMKRARTREQNERNLVSGIYTSFVIYLAYMLLMEKGHRPEWIKKFLLEFDENVFDVVSNQKDENAHYEELYDAMKEQGLDMDKLLDEMEKTGKARAHWNGKH